MASQMIRCPEGHIYDAAAHDACPDCGAIDTRPAPAADPEPQAESPKIELPDEKAREAMPSSLPKVVLSLAAIAIAAFLVWPDGTGPSGEHGAGNGGTIGAVRGVSYFGHKWQTTIPGPGGGFVCVNDVKSDGSYRLLDGCPPPFNGETGQFWLESNGAWRARADTGRFDQGVMSPIDNMNMSVTGMAGTAVWRRVD